jgi:DNA-directed RNA polymerase specialized sigma subunit
MKKEKVINNRVNRSNRYQYLLLETVCSNDMMEAFSNQESIGFRIDPFKHEEEIIDLQEELKKEFWNVVEECLTDRQKQVIKLVCGNKTQMEIAKILGVNQSSITKSLHGNVDYKNGRKVYGGASRKIIKSLETNEKVQKILDRINELREEKYE